MQPTPWYRRASGWLTVLVVMLVAAGSVTMILVTGNDGDLSRRGVRSPYPTPSGHRLIEGDGAWIAAPETWIVASDAGGSFPVLRRATWGTPLAATDPDDVERALILVPLLNVQHDPITDSDKFWADQLQMEPGTQRSGITPIAVHGYRANRVTIPGDGNDVVAAAIDTGNRIYLVAVTAPDMTLKSEPRTDNAATAIFERIIQTFDAR